MDGPIEIGDLGSHRYPNSWLEDRFSWLQGGVLVPPNWQDVLVKTHDEEIGKQVTEDSKEDEVQHQAKILAQRKSEKGVDVWLISCSYYR